MRRWIGLASLPLALTMFYAIGVAFGSALPGRLDSLAYGLVVLVLSTATVVAGSALGRRMPVAHAPWTLPVGVAATMSAWLLVPNQAAPLSYTTSGLALWAVALAALSAATVTLIVRDRWIGVSVASVGGLALVLLVPYAVVRLTLGAEASWSTAVMWTPVALTDFTFGWDISRVDALLIASRPAMIVLVGTVFMLGYAVGLGARRVREQRHDAPTAAATPA